MEVSKKKDITEDEDISFPSESLYSEELDALYQLLEKHKQQKKELEKKIEENSVNEGKEDSDLFLSLQIQKEILEEKIGETMIKISSLREELKRKKSEKAFLEIKEQDSLQEMVEEKESKSHLKKEDIQELKRKSVGILVAEERRKKRETAKLVEEKIEMKEEKTKTRKKIGKAELLKSATVLSFKKCEKCSAIVPANFKICGRCGATLKNICPNCGTRIPRGVEYCSSCNKRVMY